MRFTALQDFYSEEFGTQYVKGLVYTVRPSGSRKAKVEVGGAEAKVSGQGQTK